jgi:hypothetical protein
MSEFIAVLEKDIIDKWVVRELVAMAKSRMGNKEDTAAI